MINRLVAVSIFVLVLAPIPTDGNVRSNCEQAPGRPDAYFTGLFARDGGGWTGGDGVYSVALPDGRVVWMFGDSFLGTVHPDRSRTVGTRLIRNAYMLQDGEQFTTFHSDTPEEPSAFLAPDDPAEWYWPSDGMVENDTFYGLLVPLRQLEADMWGFAFAGHSDVAVFSLPDMTLQRIVTLDRNPRVRFGSAIVETEDYTYIYGTEDVEAEKHMHLARAHTGDFLGPWEYWDGSGWSPDTLQSARIFSEVSNDYSVLRVGEKWVLITQTTGFGVEIVRYEAASPTGPWEHFRLLYCTPEGGDDSNLFTYNALAHPEFVQDGELLISYNVNSFEFLDVFDDANNYRPRFFRVAIE